jgi:hypothetical protein
MVSMKIIACLKIGMSELLLPNFQVASSWENDIKPVTIPMDSDFEHSIDHSEDFAGDEPKLLAETVAEIDELLEGNVEYMECFW